MGAESRCPICETINERKGDPILTCARCGHWFVSASDAPSAAFYDDDYFRDRYSDYDIVVAGETPRWRAAFYLSLLRALESLTRGRRLLDVGCGLGDFLLAATSRGWDAEGIDVCEPACRIARERTGCAVRVGVLDKDVWQKESFDVVAAVDVIEHIPDPKEALATMREILRPSGLMLLVTPNRNGVSTRLFGLRNYALDAGPNGPGHVQFFSQQTLSKLVRATGFELMHSETRDVYLQNLVLAFRRLARRPAGLAQSSRGRSGQSRVANHLVNSGLGMAMIAAVNAVLRPCGLGDQIVQIARRVA